ncbi:MAG TPA: ATP-binding protein [Anaeromyxobacteraceae bacterium]|nr:ATP-binding protein [Anaeromyxobacteraceae bacterium]
MYRIVELHDRESMAREYLSALQDYLSGAGEAALARAYALGRKAATDGMGVLEFAMIHHDALRALSGSVDAPPLGVAAQFFAEGLSPFEMTLRSYQANARLLGLSEVLEQENAEINRAREQLRTILDATTAIIYLKDPEGRYLFVNRQFEEVFRVKREQAIGKTDDLVLPKELAQERRGVDLQILEARVPRELEELVPTSDGVHTYLSLKFPLLDASGLPYGICCVATDITERNRAAEALQREREAAERERQLRQAVKVRDEFLSIASHEFKTPLTSLELQIASFRRLASSNPRATLADGVVQAKCEAIERQVERLGGLVKQLLDVARATSGRLEICREKLDLCVLVRDVLARMQQAIRGSGSEVVVRAASPVVGSWDRTCVDTAIANLISNAIKFGEGKPVEITVEAVEGCASLSVRDQGIGIPAEDRQRIFERFGRAVSVRHFGGFGIGLWVARQAVEAHGGRITVVSQLGAGSTFIVELPLAGQLQK